MRAIKAANDAIPGEEISEKIARMEMLVDRIFDRVERKPDTVSDIRKLMDYYLPMTMKLLQAYEDLDAQPVQGENIISSKIEIEKTIDTLNVAFEKLLDDLFSGYGVGRVVGYIGSEYDAGTGRTYGRRDQKVKARSEWRR